MIKRLQPLPEIQLPSRSPAAITMIVRTHRLQLGLLALCLLATSGIAQDKGGAKPVGAPPPTSAPESKPTLLREAGAYSETHPVITIAIAKGQKETTLTAEQIGDKLVEAIQRLHRAPAKYFTAPGGDYTAVAFFVNGEMDRPYSLKESLSGLSLAADNYWYKVHRGVIPGPDAAPAKKDAKQ